MTSFLLEKIRIEILDTGFRENHSDVHLIYLPAIVVQVTNRSPKPLNDIRFEAYFKNRGSVVCLGEFDLDMLGSGENKSAVLVCPRLDGQNYVPGTPGLNQMNEPISFELWLKAPGIAMVVENGRMEPKLLFNL